MISEELVNTKMDDVLESDFDPTKFRLSNTGKCQRYRMLKVLGYDLANPTEEQAQYFERGNMLENWFVDQIINQFPRKTRKQVEVPTPYGDTGHMDIWFPNPPDDDATIIEVKSVSEKAKHYQLPKEDHIKQVQSYMHFYRDSRGNRRANRAEINYIFFGRKLETQAFEIKYDKLMGESIESELKQLHQWKDEEYVPNIPEGMEPDEFPCFWVTGDGHEGHCPAYEHCWADHIKEVEGDETPDYTGDDTIEKLFNKYQKIKDKYSEANKNVRQLKKEKKKIEKALNFHFGLRKTDKMIANGIRIKKTDVSGKIYWKPEKALKQNLIDEETLEKIRQVSNQSDGYTRFYVKQLKGDK